MKGVIWCAVLFCVVYATSAAPLNLHSDLTDILDILKNLGLIPSNDPASTSSPDNDLGSGYTSDTSQCGRQTATPSLSRIKKIIDGRPAVSHSWPWQVSIYDDDEHHCGGSIIDDTRILTAAHCFENRKQEDFYVVVGMHRISATNDNRIIMNISGIIIHSQYFNGDHDIAIIKLTESLNFSEQIQPICLPVSNQVPNADDSNCVVTGWGETRRNIAEEEPNIVSDVLLQANITILNDSFCNKYYENSLQTNSVFCGTARHGDTCQGDSGGPVQCPNADGSWYLAGVTSWGDYCGGEAPGVYTQVGYFLDWIDENT